MSKPSAKRGLSYHNVEADDGDLKPSAVAASATAKKPTKKQKLANDVALLKSIIGEVQDASIKSTLASIIENQGAVPAPAVAAPAKKLDEAATERLAETTVKTVQKLINEKLKWKGSFKQMSKTGDKKGGRVEVVCQDPEVFERIFSGATAKRSKDGKKITVSVKTDDEAAKWRCPFSGKRYRYNSAYLSHPYTASWSDSKLTFSYKFGIY